MDDWISCDEADFPLWVHELDPHLHALNHKRACVWFNELDGQWQWEIETFHDSGITAGGVAASQAEAMTAAEAAASAAS
jgi:hypothetical protein